MAQRDPDAAALLAAQIEVERGSPGETMQPDLAIYDPLDLYCRLAREFGWSHHEMDNLDYVIFFGYVDRLSKQQRRERAEIQGSPGSRVVSSLPPEYYEAEAYAQAAQFAPMPRSYQGRTVPLS